MPRGQRVHPHAKGCPKHQMISFFCSVVIRVGMYILKLFPQGVKMSKPNDATSWKITRFLLTCGIGHRHGRTGHMVINDRPLKIHR